MPDIVICEFIDEAAVEELLAGRDVLYDPALADRPEALHAALAQARGLVVRNRTQVRGALLAAAPRLNVVGRLGVGLDNIDVEACAARGIAVRPATGANDTSVAEYVIATAMMLLRSAYCAGARVAAGEWPRDELVRCGREISGKTLGLVGFGSIGRETARMARALGMRVVAHDPYLAEGDPAWALAEPHGLDALLRAADVVSLHVPLTPGTRGLIGAEALQHMKAGGVLINAARGGVVDEAALAAAIREGRLWGAALDVFEEEPLRARQGALFADLPNVILTPHLAGVTIESNARVSRVTVEAVLRELEGG